MVGTPERRHTTRHRRVAAVLARRATATGAAATGSCPGARICAWAQFVQPQQLPQVDWARVAAALFMVAEHENRRGQLNLN